MQTTVDRRVMRQGAATLGLVALAVIAMTTARWFVWPDTDDPTRADAIVMLAGGQGERLPVARRLAERGLASTPVIMNGTDPVWTQANELCANEHAFAVVCPTPDPDTTRGEARATAALASDKSWTSLILVTSDYHVHRASILLDRCFDGDVAVVAATATPVSSHESATFCMSWSPALPLPSTMTVDRTTNVAIADLRSRKTAVEQARLLCSHDRVTGAAGLTPGSARNSLIVTLAPKTSPWRPASAPKSFGKVAVAALNVL